MNTSEALGDLALTQTSLLFVFKCQLVSKRKLDLYDKNSEVFIKTRSPPASLPFRGQVAKHTTVKWSVATFIASSTSVKTVALPA